MKTTQVNGLWWFAITSEMALNFNTGLVNRGGSPFAQFRKVFPECPRGKREALLWVNELAKANNLRLSNSFMKTIEKL